MSTGRPVMRTLQYPGRTDGSLEQLVLKMEKSKCLRDSLGGKNESLGTPSYALFLHLLLSAYSLF